LAILRKRIDNTQNPFVICEASGGYERRLVNYLHAQATEVSLVNPAQVRSYARSQGVRAKTDPLDARILLEFAQHRQPKPTTPAEPARIALAELMDRRAQLTEQLAREKNRLQKDVPRLLKSIRRMIRILEKEIAKLDDEIRAVLDTDPALLRQNEQMQSVKGKRRIEAGRAKVRRCLYMAAQTAAQHNPVIRDYVAGLTSRGKHYKMAMVAAMRKLLIHIQSILKQDQKCLA
jgi:transposase